MQHPGFSDRVLGLPAPRPSIMVSKIGTGWLSKPGTTHQPLPHTTVQRQPNLPSQTLSLPSARRAPRSGLPQRLHFLQIPSLGTRGLGGSGLWCCDASASYLGKAPDHGTAQCCVQTTCSGQDWRERYVALTCGFMALTWRKLREKTVRVPRLRCCSAQSGMT